MCIMIFSFVYTLLQHNNSNNQNNRATQKIRKRQENEKEARKKNTHTHAREENICIGIGNRKVFTLRRETKDDLSQRKRKNVYYLEEGKIGNVCE